MSSDCFDKPTWTLRALAAAAPPLVGHLARVAPTLLDRPIPATLRERIMLAVATENRCFYCRTAHRVLGEAAGVPAPDVRRLLDGETPARSEGERLALAFVRDLARRGFQSRDEALWEALGAHWSPVERAAIESAAHVMNLANRFGNTFDAALARLRGRCVAGGAGGLDLLVIPAAFVPGALAMLPVLAGAGLRVAWRRLRQG